MSLRVLCFADNYAPAPSWHLLRAWLAIAFVLRAIVALSGDFVLHPDEILQYLEPAHKLVFGNGVVFWEYFYGARSWVVPGMVAGVLWLSKLAGIGEPWFYIDAVKIMFCLLSLLIPWGVYHYSRSIISESASRLALILTCLWPYLIAYAHKPFTEFVAANIFMLALGLAALPAARKGLLVATVGLLITLVAFIRFQYAPVAIVLWLATIVSLRAKPALIMFGGSLAAVALIGTLEWISWGGLFHSYKVNILVNLALDEFRDAQPYYFYVPRLLYATAGGFLLMIWACARQPRAYFLIGTCMLILFTFHSFFTAHKEFRFVFLLLVLSLIPLAGWFTQLSASFVKTLTVKLPMILASVYCVLVLTNALPYEKWLHEAASLERGEVNYLRGQNNLFEVYRVLAELENVKGVMHIPDPYFNTPAYYYLHHQIPFYSTNQATIIQQQYQLGLTQLASHIVTKDVIANASFSTLISDGEYKLYALVAPAGQEVVPWKQYTPSVIGESMRQLAQQLFGDGRPLPRIELSIE